MMCPVSQLRLPYSICSAGDTLVTHFGLCWAQQKKCQLSYFLLFLYTCWWYTDIWFVFQDAGLQPYLDQINVIEEQVAALEQAAYKLDAYSKKLGNYFYFYFDYLGFIL